MAYKAADKLTLKFVKLHPKTETNNIWKDDPNKINVVPAAYPKSPLAGDDSIENVKESLEEVFGLFVENINEWMQVNEEYFQNKYGKNADQVMYKTAWNLVRNSSELEITEDVATGVLTGLTALGVGALTGGLAGGPGGALGGAAISGIFNASAIKDAFMAGKDDKIKKAQKKRDGLPLKPLSPVLATEDRIDEISQGLKDRYAEKVHKDIPILNSMAYRFSSSKGIKQPKHWAAADKKDGQDSIRRLRNRVNGLERVYDWKKSVKEENELEEKICPEKKKLIQTALGPKGDKYNKLRQTSKSARALISLAKNKGK